MISRIEGRGGKMYSFCAMYSLRMSFCSVPPTFVPRRPVLLGDREVHRERDRRRRVDRHRGRDARRGRCRRRGPPCRASESIATPHLPTSPRGHLVVRVVAVESRQVEGRREARSGRGRGGSGSAGWSASPCRSRRTGASSRACRGTPSAGRRGCTGTRPASRGRARSRSPAACREPRAARPARPRPSSSLASRPPPSRMPFRTSRPSAGGRPRPPRAPAGLCRSCRNDTTGRGAG